MATAGRLGSSLSQENAETAGVQSFRLMSVYVETKCEDTRVPALSDQDAAADADVVSTTVGQIWSSMPPGTSRRSTSLSCGPSVQPTF